VTDKFLSLHFEPFSFSGGMAANSGSHRSND